MTTTTLPPATDYPMWQQQWWLERQKLRRKRGLPELGEGWFHNNDTAQKRRLAKRETNHRKSWPKEVGDLPVDPTWASRQNDRDKKVLQRFKSRYGVKGPITFLRDTDYTPSPVPVKESNELSEVSKDLLHRYLRRATTEHGMANFAARQTEQEKDKTRHNYWQRMTNNRKKGISRAYDRIDHKDD